jgi:mono/diheme cytochrome c family protein
MACRPFLALLAISLRVLCAASGAFAAEVPPGPPRAEMHAKHRAFLEEHCKQCHGPEKQKGKFRVDDLPFVIEDLQNAERWQKILNSLNSGEMPPEEEKQPPTEAKADFLDDLANAIVAARRALNDQHGVITMRRLNRREYKNTLRELLGVEINVAELPSDTGTGGFDTFGSNLFMSANQFEQYQSLGLQALDEAFTRFAASGEELKLHIEAEDNNVRIRKNYQDQLNALEHATEWAKAVEEAAASPENAIVVAELRKAAKNQDLFLREWAKIKGAPAPESFGFNTKENNADKATRALGYGTKMGTGFTRPYHENYLKKPHLDTVAYLTVSVGDLGNDSLQWLIPYKWPAGDYIVRVRLGHTPESAPEQRYIEFGTNPRNGRPLSTHAVAGTIEQPEIIEMPLTITKEHSTNLDRTIFLREKGTNDHYEQTRRIFNAGKAKNGRGPELAIWVDWFEIERKTANKKPKEPELVKFGIGDNRQVGSVTAKGVNKVRFECETANEKVSKYVKEQIDARANANAWVHAVNAAAANPENATVVAEIRKDSKNEAIFRRSWDKLKGAPSPESFGFKTTENNADKANSALAENWQKYHEYYLSRSHLDQGAYLGTPTMHPAVMALGFMQLPVPGEWTSGNYIFRVRLAAAKDARPEQKFLEMGMHPRNGMVRATFEITGTMDKPQIVEMPFTLTKAVTDSGDRTLFIREKGAWDNNEEGGRKRQEAVKRNGIGPEAVLWIDYMEIERVSEPADAAPGLAVLGIPIDDASTVTEVKPALQSFCAAAFRGIEPPANFADKLTDIYETQRKAGVKHSAALKETLSVVLASPMFLYLAEPSHEAKRNSLTHTELANRLSYFIWSAPPDAELLKADLNKPEVLAAQTARMLDDDRSQELVHGFVHQWLGLDRIDFFQVNRAMHPRFDDSTKLNAKKEVFATFAHLLRHNGPLSDLLKADYAIINHLLADFYGIEGVKGDAFQKVSLPADSPRGGLLGMAAIHFMGGNGERTSPVERGAWVLRKLLHDPPPPAPANVPAITRLAGKVLTTHERLLAHQEDPQCASCHRKIDPIGFGLENFDAAGQWRTEDSYTALDANGKPDPKSNKTWAIDSAAAFHKGPAFKDYFALRDIIASKSDAFARSFSEALIEFGLGRPLGFRDEPLVNEMIAQAGKKDLAMRVFIHALINSREFHMK